MKTTITTLFTIVLLFVSYQSLTNASGPPAGFTNAPGDNGNCSNAASGCHGTSAVTSGTVWNGMSLTVVGATLSTLVHNTTYTFNLTFSQASRIKYGFQLCVLEAGATASSASLGTLVSTNSETQIVTGGSRDYLEHTSSGTSAPTATKTWTFDWTTPASYTGGATFYVVVNSTDNNGSATTGDVIYAKTFAATISLPVTWLYTKAAREKDDVLISWATASEKNNWKFDIEKSSDRNEWTTIGSVRGEGNSSVINRYSFSDIRSAEAAYYRVKQIDFNGEYSYSDMVSIDGVSRVSNEPSVNYDADKSVYVVQGNNVTGIQVTNMNGETKYAASGEQSGYTIPAMNPGIYLVQIHTASNTYYQKVLMH